MKIYLVLFKLLAFVSLSVSDKDFGVINCDVAPHNTVCTMNEVCKVRCISPCNTTDVKIWGAEVYTYDSPICISAAHDLRISIWNSTAQSVTFQRIPHSNIYHSLVRFGLRSLPYGDLQYAAYGSYKFLSPRISEVILDIASVHFNYLYGNGESHIQECILSSFTEPRDAHFNLYQNQIQFPRYLATTTSNYNIDSLHVVKHTIEWPGWMMNITSGGYECSPNSTMLSTPLSIAMRKDADFMPPVFTMTANLNDNINLKMNEVGTVKLPTEWRKDSLLLGNIFDNTKRRTELVMRNVQVGSAGIYSLQYLQKKDSNIKKGIMRLIVRVCPEGLYGDNCTSVCEACFNGGICHDITGVCICPPGFNGTHCENVCQPGHFGQNCSMGCTDEVQLKNISCKNHLICLPDPYGCSCAAGFKTVFCNVSCDPGEYGANCFQRRECHCAGNENCNIFSGTCLNGCMNGWHSPECTISFPVLRDPPQLVDASKNTLSMSFMPWNPSIDDGVGKPNSYLVLYKEMKPNSTWIYGPSIKPKGQSRLNFTLSDLKPSTMYSVAVAIHDVSGQMPIKTVKSLDVYTLCTKPDRPPFDVVILTTETLVSLEWKIPPEITWNCLSVVTVLKYWSGYWNSTVTNATNYTFPSKPFVSWKFELCLKPLLYDDSEATCSSIFSNTTKEGRPGRVGSVEKHFVNSKDATLTWSEPTEKNGVIRYYEVRSVQVRWVHRCILQNSTIHTTNTTTNFLYVDDLRPSSVYSIAVSAVTVAKGPSQFVTLTTKGDVPDSEPLDVTYQHANNTLVWSAPPCHLSNGEIASYHVFISGMDVWDGRNQSNITINTHMQLSDLIPYSGYFVRVFTENTYGVSNKFAGLPIHTDPGIPHAPTELTIFSRAKNSLDLSWKPPYPPRGVLSYYLISYSYQNNIMDEMNLSATNAICSNVHWLKYHCFSATGLVSERIYTFEITAFNEGVTTGSPLAKVQGETSESVPEAPTEVHTIDRNGKSLNIRWSMPTVTNGNITNYQITVSRTGVRKSSAPILKEHVISMGEYQNFTISNLSPASDYFVCIQAGTRAGYGAPICKVFNTSNIAPVMDVAPVLLKVSHKGAFVKLLPSKISGDIVSAYFVVVDTFPWQEDLHAHLNASFFFPRNCSDATGTHDAEHYVATRIDKLPKIGLNFTVGDGTCKDGYYNALLHINKLYRIGLAAVCRYETNEDIYSNIKFIDKLVIIPKEPPKLPETYHTRVVLGFLIPFLAIVIIIAILIYIEKPRWIMRKKHKATLKLEVFPEIELGVVNEAIEDDLIETESICGEFSNRISLADLENSVQTGLRDGSIKKEYMSLPRGQRFPCGHAKLLHNRLKNRYGNLLPYDHSRVVLDKVEGELHSDYINANYIDGFQKTQKYIATQGPKPTTVNDFWRMIWNKGSCKILMATNLIENGKVKCEKYWPDEKPSECKIFENIMVTFVSSESTSDYITRTFSVQCAKEKREVKQFHFHTWPDHRVPLYLGSVVSFLKTVNSYNPSCTAPVIVHCSAGIGRTGTLILLDSMLEMGKTTDFVDAIEHLSAMRRHRCNIVENVDQYIFVYNCLVETFCYADTCIPCSEIKSRMKVLLAVESKLKMSPLQKEFELTELVQCFGVQQKSLIISMLYM